MLERDSVMTCLPGWPRSSPARSAAARTKSGRPARSASPSRTSLQACSSASTFWPNVRAERREALVDLGDARLGVGVEAGAGAHEAGVVALEHAALLGIELLALAARVRSCRRARKGRGSSEMSVPCFDRIGAMSRSIACSSGFVCEPVQIVENAQRRASAAAPDFSIASMVLAKVGEAVLDRIFSTSALCVSMPLSKAGRKCAGLIRSNGGSSNGAVHFAEQRIAPRRGARPGSHLGRAHAGLLSTVGAAPTPAPMPATR